MSTASTVVHIIVHQRHPDRLLSTWVKKVSRKAKRDGYAARALGHPSHEACQGQSGGGGGGGDRDKFQAPKGKIPKPAMEQITPPAIVVRNDHPKLTVEPTVVMPPQVKLANNTLNLGNPTAAMPSGSPSNGTGSGGGIGSGTGGGIGVGLDQALGKVAVAESAAACSAWRRSERAQGYLSA